MKILLTAKQRGSTNALAPVARELQRRGHQLQIYATGNKQEAAGFGDLSYQRIDEGEPDYYHSLVEGYDALISGLSGDTTGDGSFIRAGNRAGIPSLAILDQNNNYQERFGGEIGNLPTLIAVMDEMCLPRIQRELGMKMATEKMAKEVERRIKVTGWTAYDHLSQAREEFSDEQREALRKQLVGDSDAPLFVYLSQNIHPSTEYMRTVSWEERKKVDFFRYEMEVTRAVLEEAKEHDVSLIVKPHPGERASVNFTEQLVRSYRNTHFLPAEACKTQDLLLTAAGVFAGRSSCLAEACLLDRHVGAVLPELAEEEREAFLPVTLRAIPSAEYWCDVPTLVETIIYASQDEETNQTLARNRKRFSVDGKASERIADIVEEMN